MLSECDGGYDLHLSGFVVNRCIVDYAFSLDIVEYGAGPREERHAHLRVVTPFACDIGGTCVYVDRYTTRRRSAPCWACCIALSSAPASMMTARSTSRSAVARRCACRVIQPTNPGHSTGPGRTDC